MEQSLDVQHSCDGMVTSVAPQSACAEVVGLGWGGILIALAVVAGLLVVGWFLWRTMKNRNRE